MKQPKAEAKAYCHKNILLAAVVVADPIVAVRAELFCGGLFYGHGGARCCHLDVFSEERGVEIAMGRAAADIANQLVEQGRTPWLDA